MRAFSSSGASIAIEKFNNENILHPYVGDESDMADCDMHPRSTHTLSHKGPSAQPDLS